MSETQAYYRAPVTAEPVATYLREVRQRKRAFIEARDALLSELPEGAQAMVTQAWETTQIVGVACDTEPGPLWAKKAGEYFWRPVRKSAAGKRLALRMGGIRLNLPGIPGVPEFVQAGLRLTSAGLNVFGEDCWLMWSCPAEAVEAHPKFDAALWQRAKASEYHLAKEAHEAQIAAEVAHA